MINTPNKIRYSDIFIEHPLLQKKESEKNIDNTTKSINKDVKEELHKNDEKLIRRKSAKLKKCRRKSTENTLLKDDSTENTLLKDDSTENTLLKDDSTKVDKVFSEFKLNNIIYFYDDKDQKCVLKNNSGNLCNVFSKEQPKKSEVIDSNYKLMEDSTNVEIEKDNIEKNEFLMEEIGKKKQDNTVEDTTCIII